MGNAAHSSAGVYPHEMDLSQVAQGVASSIGAIVGASSRGPVNSRVLITDTKKFLFHFGEPKASTSFMHYCALAFLEHSSRLWVTRVAKNFAYGGATLAANSSGIATVRPWVSPGSANPLTYAFTASELFIVYAANPGTWNSELQVRIYPNAKSSNGTFYIDVYKTGVNSPLERHLCHLDFKLDGYGVQLNVEAKVNRASSYIKVKQNYDNAAFVANRSASLVNALSSASLVGGSNGSAINNTDICNAWELYRDPEKIDVNILINGGYTDVSVQHAMDGICQDRGDCIAVLDQPSDKQRTQDALTHELSTLALDTTYSAIYSPDILMLDPYNDIRLYVPPSGHVAGAYARTDNEAELWFAPAGMSRGRLNVLGVRETYDQGDRDALADAHINVIRVIAGSGIRIWGADTLSSMTSALSNVSVRRLMLFLEKSLSRAALYSVFDPNDEILRTSLVDICTRFLNPIKDARGMYEFGVVCDETNNPPEVMASGDLMLDVYIDPVLPAKRIHLNAIVTKTGARFNAT